MPTQEEVTDWTRVAWTGSRYIDVLDPQPEDVKLEEVAVGLSRQIRYGANVTAIPWPVTKHSLLCLWFAEDDGVYDEKLRRTILLHDGPEYILGDMIAPLKNHCPEYRAIEDRWWQVFCDKFDLYYNRPTTRFYDMLALASEKAALISPDAGEWPFAPRPREVPESVLNAADGDARRSFVRKARELLPGGGH